MGMPQFEIHDDVTGLKLLVEGPSEPTPEESQALVEAELQFLSTNLYRADNNRFMLDVGPLGPTRHVVDDTQKLLDKLREFQNRRKAIQVAAERVDRMIQGGWDLGEGKDGEGLFKNIYAQELAALGSNLPTPTLTEQSLERISPGTLLLISHGSPTGGLVSEGGLPFTLHNVAQLLGPTSNEVRNVINTACYGGGLCPENYKDVFPNVTNIQHTALDRLNIQSLDMVAKGDFFHTNAVPGTWELAGTNWLDKPNILAPNP